MKPVFSSLFLSAFFVALTSLPLHKAMAQASAETSAKVSNTLLRYGLNPSQSPYVALEGGAANSDNGQNNAFAYGVEAGVETAFPYTLALEINTFSNPRNTSSVLDRTRALVKGSYRFHDVAPFIDFIYVGAGVGPVWDSYGGTTYGRLGFDVQTGFDIPLNSSGLISSNSITLGANANYLFVSSDAPNTFGLNGVMKYWF